MAYSNDIFRIESADMPYEDSIVMPMDQYNDLTVDELRDMKCQRYRDFRFRSTQAVQPSEELVPVDPNAVSLSVQDSEEVLDL